ncbi:hypothetical protein MRX96_017676 [Rhipicephalus microplus]
MAAVTSGAPAIPCRAGWSTAAALVLGVSAASLGSVQDLRKRSSLARNTTSEITAASQAAAAVREAATVNENRGNLLSSSVMKERREGSMGDRGEAPG